MKIHERVAQVERAVSERVEEPVRVELRLHSDGRTSVVFMADYDRKILNGEWHHTVYSDRDAEPEDWDALFAKAMAQVMAFDTKADAEKRELLARIGAVVEQAEKLCIDVVLVKSLRAVMAEINEAAITHRREAEAAP